MKVLVINSGSSSIKYELFDMSIPVSLATGLVERIGAENSCLTQKVRQTGSDDIKTVKETPVPDHQAGLKLIGEALFESKLADDPNELFGIGHRVVHGGEAFTEPSLIDERVIQTIREQSPLAPLHNPANLVGIEEAMGFAPKVPQVAVFDTSFHQTIPEKAYLYALPQAIYKENRVRRYGFHGTSHRYVTKQAAKYLGKPLDETNLIVFHLGNGASVTAVRGGKSVDVSLGMTPLEGLIMGTRSGDIDPAIIFYLIRTTGKSPDEVEALLNKESGLKGICGVSDMREVRRLADEGDSQAELALHMVAYRIKKYLGAYYAVLGRVDAVVFTAGIGENTPYLREQSCADLEALGIVLDPEKNNQPTEGISEIQADTSRIKVLVIPTDEELEIAEETVTCIQAAQSGS